MLLVASCRRIGDPPPLDYPEQRQERTLRRINFLRGLELDAVVPVESLDDASFFERLRRISEQSRVRAPAGDAGGDHGEHVLTGLQLLGARVDAVDESMLIDEKIAAAYDAVRKSLILRTSHSMEGREPAENVLAHELFHAVQHRHFGLADYSRTNGLDEAMALKALYEGDASMVGVAAEYQRSGSSWKALVAKLSRIVYRKPLQAAIPSSLYAPDPGPNPSAERIMSLFFYVYGLAFVHEIYLAGGFELVNATYRHPPRSTEQVLHPERYLAGELPVVIGPPPVPEGLERIAEGTFGELMLREVISSCSGWEKACSASAGWGGDRFLIAADATGRRAMLWVVVWDTPEAARRFEQLLDELAGCWLDASAIRPAALIDEHVAVRRAGRLVAIVHGLPAARCPAVFDGLTSVPVQPAPPAPPPALGKRRAPLPENPALPAGRLPDDSSSP